MPTAAMIAKIPKAIKVAFSSELFLVAVVFVVVFMVFFVLCLCLFVM